MVSVAVVNCSVERKRRNGGVLEAHRDGKERIGPNEPISEDFRDHPCYGRIFSWKCGRVADLSR